MPPYSTRSTTLMDAPVYIPGYGRVQNGRVPAEVAAEQASRDQNNAWWAERNARQDRYRKIGTAAVLGIGGGAALAGMMGGAAPSFGIGAANTGQWTTTLPNLAGPATAGGGLGGTVAPVAKGASKLAAMFTSPLASTIAGGLFSLGAQRSQNKAADQARRDTLVAQAEALKLQREQLEMEARNADLDREDARALNTAINELKKRELDAAEEARAFDREQALYLRSKDEAAEQRRTPYRQAGQAALGRLMSMWGM